MIRAQKYLLLTLSVFLFSCEAQNKEVQFEVKTGSKVLIENHLKELKDKKLGLVMNQSARVDGVHMLDTLLALGMNITALFAPEHGFRGNSGAGEIIENGIDQATQLPVYSLYGDTKSPTSKMLEEVDLLIFDMQDVGARFYTYNTTMKYVLEAGAEYGKEVWILDRPNPAGGNYIAGWVLEEEFESFIGSYPIPIAHGLTLGELALMALRENWLEIDKELKLKIVKMEGWNRAMKWPETGLNWLPPSPNLPTYEHAFVYLGTCFFEGTTLSEGRGTPDPFLTIGSPTTHVDKDLISDLENRYKVKLDTISFMPHSIPGKAYKPKFEGEKSFGLSIQPTTEFDDPVAFGTELLHLLINSSQGAEYTNFLYLLSGTKKIDSQNSQSNWGTSFTEFVIKRKEYLLYN